MRRVIPALIVLACVLAPAPAGASKHGGQKVLKECADHGVIANPSAYTPDDYRWALKNIASDLAEYTACQDEIRRAQAAAESQRHGGAQGGGAGAGGIGGGGGDNSPPTPQEKKAIEDAARHAESVRIGGSRLSPAGHGLAASALTHSLPNSLLVLLILITIAVLARAATTIRSRVIARGQA